MNNYNLYQIHNFKLWIQQQTKKHLHGDKLEIVLYQINVGIVGLNKHINMIQIMKSIDLM